ncbi:hypothetical protein Bhyg_06467 [Pseudolycoriella hygida]|uniref:Uncharacterized protein n=1 Tax=Pseudolycoriella hygida TaxID=35572 RepID=A0A9Q0N0T9_9DIPT|nr:hypothetical protein Bhyg_06467 [Pseudolycoriella hygida]
MTNLLMESFIRDEPMCHALGLTEKLAKPIIETLFLETAVRDKISYLAYDKRTEKVVCAYIGSLHRRDDVNDNYQIDNSKNPLINVMDFLDILGSGIWQILPEDGMCNEEAQRLGCKYAVSLATSYQTQVLNEKLDFVTHRFINYSDYRVLGRAVFANAPPPHTCAKLMIKKF